jgi:hypothetical protein
MIPQPFTLDGRSGTIVYMDAHWQPVPPEQATMAKAVFDDGAVAFYFAESDAKKREYVREPAGSPEGGRFAETADGLPLNANGQVAEANGQWNRSASGEKPYHWQSRHDDPTYVVPKVYHTVVRDGGTWGYSHGNSQAITGSSASKMNIPGYRDTADENDNSRAMEIADRFLTNIAADDMGSEEVLHHAFENTRHTVFKVGDTLRLPLMAASGDIGGSYAIRSYAETQRGEPVVFEFEPGTQMSAYSTVTLRDAKDLDHPTVEAAIKERGYLWDEAIVAGGFEVVSVTTKYMGSQHSDKPELSGADVTSQIYGKVVRLRQRETFSPSKGWVPRG